MTTTVKKVIPGVSQFAAETPASASSPTKRPIRKVEFAGSVEVIKGCWTCYLDSEIQHLRGANGLTNTPVMWRDSDTSELVIGSGEEECRYPLAGGLVRRYWFARAAKGK